MKRSMQDDMNGPLDSQLRCTDFKGCHMFPVQRQCQQNHLVAAHVNTVGLRLIVAVLNCADNFVCRRMRYARYASQYRLTLLQKVSFETRHTPAPFVHTHTLM
jgi:hypothetical protein